MSELPDVGLATGTASLAWLLFALPAFGALVLLLAGRRADPWGHWLGVGTVAASFVVGVLVFLDTLWPDVDRRHLWQAVEQYAARDRRYGGAVPNDVPESGPDEVQR